MAVTKIHPIKSTLKKALDYITNPAKTDGKVLKMAQQQYINHLYEVEDRSLNEIAEMTGFNFRTIQKYAYQDNWSVEYLPDVEPGSCPVLGDFIPVIDL